MNGLAPQHQRAVEAAPPLTDTQLAAITRLMRAAEAREPAPRAREGR